MFAPISREGGLLLNNLLLATATATVLLGTLYPLVLDTMGGAKISVGPPFFNATFVPLMVPLVVAVPIGSMLAWKRGDLRRRDRAPAGRRRRDGGRGAGSGWRWHDFRLSLGAARRRRWASG